MKQELLRYWPHDEDVVACIKTDAEASSEAVSLAVHQPMRFERRIIGGSGSPEPCDEHQLLRAFLATDLPEERVILPIVGSSGVGKSHVVRWLDTQIRSSPDAGKRVVIRIPKGTSLRGVLGILLEKVRGPNYDNYSRELLRAQEELDPKEAAGLLCEMLAHTLIGMADDASRQLIDKPGDKEAQERDAYCRAEMLPALLRNQQLRDQHFVRRADGSDGVVKRLVEHLTQSREAGTDDDRKRQFTPEDLDFTRVEINALGRAEQKALNTLNREDRRATATRLLNAALDGAKQRLLRLDPTVSDLFDDVRRELLKEGKELILLIEDFAVLSGLQKQLLQIIIKEAVRDGRQVLCTMRTALAYTAGYLDTATVLTRANAEYHIPNEPGAEDEMLRGIERLVGAYLNAARLGQRELESQYQQRDLTHEHWTPIFLANVEPDARTTLEAFGVSEDGHFIFPFNKAAIAELAKEGCMQDGRLVYNPRYVIQNVITKVLRHRSLFEQSAFPPSSFGSRTVPAKVLEDVRKKVPSAQLDRYLRFLPYWGGLPGTPTDVAAIPERIFAAFDLSGAAFHRKGQPSPEPKSAPVATPTPTPTPPPRVTAPQPNPERSVDPIETRWEQILERWRSGATLHQQDANQLRKWVAEALKGAIDWNWILYRPLDELTKRDEWNAYWFTYVFIPNAGGNEGRDPSDAMVALCSEDDLGEEARSARVHSTLMSIIRFHGIHKASSWDYEDAEIDLPLYAAFLDEQAPRARTFIRARHFRAPWNPVPTLVNALLVGARALGIDGADRSDDEALLNAIFLAAPIKSLPVIEDDETGWSQFLAELTKCRRTADKESRDQLSWTTHLLNLIGARQGRGDTFHALDTLTLKAALEETVATWTLAGSLPSPSGAPEFTAAKGLHSELKKRSSAVAKAAERLRSWRSSMVEWIGDEFDKDGLVREMKAVVETAKAAGLAREVDTKKLFAAIEAFRMTSVVAALDDAKRLTTDADRGTVLAVLGRSHDTTVKVCEDLRTRFETFLSTVDAEVEAQIILFGADPLAQATTELTTELTGIERLLTEMSP